MHLPVSYVGSVFGDIGTEEADEAELPRVLGMLKQIDDSHRNINEWAVRFGLS